MKGKFIMFEEIITLHNTLTYLGIPHVFQPLLGGHQVLYRDSCGNFVCSAVQHRYSYGGTSGFIEIMGLLYPSEAESDDVAGWLTAKEVATRIQLHYNQSHQ
jgi:hypothetical protein